MLGKLQAQDWPYLKKYQSENATLKSISSKQKRIVLMGDSITEFWSTIDPEFFESKSYINRGISGQTSPQMLIRFRADVIELKPSAVVILTGANDIAGNTGLSSLEMIMHNIISMVELAEKNQIKVILCSVLPANLFPWKINENPADTIILLNEMIRKYAGSKKTLYLDYYSDMVNKQKGMISTYSNDGVHPNKKGYEIMGPLLDSAIELTLT
ncbi:acylhydrolase [Flavobacterium cellulosilyticum]|uniref:Acylhydrolase n=2 Tax=Flavobacterium cellulosilyticum TaxID=2541731 RepID=A0A4R5CIE3_9FLAO|nr:acylhydrolase [Flavobacterium cellulosilyticum]